ncbi:MAG: response regulator [Planctomycetes bacterium]|nr:response regulator [Planctomycetota bacterium]
MGEGMVAQRLLVVDDDRGQIAAVSSILSMAGYDIDTAGSGDVALKLAARKTFDLAILDYQMPTLNGIDVFKKMHELQPKMHGILLTAYTTIDKVFPAIDCGLDHVVAKPVNAVELVRVVRELVGPPGASPATDD